MAGWLDSMLHPHRLMSQHFARGRRCDIRFSNRRRDIWTGKVSWVTVHDDHCPCGVERGLLLLPLTETPGYLPG